MKIIKVTFIVLVSGLLAFTFFKPKPVLYIIGDSTVKNGDGTGKNNQMGWGTMIDMYFDTTKTGVQPAPENARERAEAARDRRDPRIDARGRNRRARTRRRGGARAVSRTRTARGRK